MESHEWADDNIVILSKNKRIIEVNSFMPHAFIIELLTDFFSFNTLRKFYEKRSRPKYGTSEYFWMALQRRIDNPPPPHEPYVAPCGGTGNHSDPSWPWWEERKYQDDDDSPAAQASRLQEARKLEREDTERAQEAIELRERLERGYRVYGWDKLERPVSIVEP